MKPEDADEFTQALAQIIAGGFRQIRLAPRLGVTKALDLTDEAWLKKYLGDYVQLGVEQQREVLEAVKAAGVSNRTIAKAAGVSEATVRRDLGASPKTHRGQKRPKHKGKTSQPVGAASPVTQSAPLDVVAGVAVSAQAQEVATREAEKQAAKEEAMAETKKRREASQNAGPRPDGFTLRIGDAREVLADIAPDSVHLILTDPPYGDAAEPLYEWLAMWAARVLVPGGSLICFTGQSRLDRDMEMLKTYLRWWWLLTLEHDQAQRLPGKFVMAEFKPVLWFVKDHRRGRTLVNDRLRSRGRDKTEHGWGQGDGGVELLIQQLTDPDEVIVDPFAGTAKWGELAARMGRVWIGADVVAGGDTVAVTTTKET